MKTETCKLHARVLWIFLENVIKIDSYNFELYRFKVGAFLRHSVVPVTLPLRCMTLPGEATRASAIDDSLPLRSGLEVRRTRCCPAMKVLHITRFYSTRDVHVQRPNCRCVLVCTVVRGSLQWLAVDIISTFCRSADWRTYGRRTPRRLHHRVCRMQCMYSGKQWRCSNWPENCETINHCGQHAARSQ